MSSSKKINKIKIILSSLFKNKHILNPLFIFQFIYLYFKFNKKLKIVLNKEIKQHFENDQVNNLDNTKYLDIDIWIFENLSRFFKLGLHKVKELNILDISTGFGYFPYLCNELGHYADGTDIDSSQHNLYKKVTKKLNVNIHSLEINKYKKFSFDTSYDFITSFMICFNGHMSKEVWHIEEWIFFLKQINKVLKKDGTLFLSFNRENKKEPIDIKLLDYFSNIGAKIEGTEITLHKDCLP